MLVVDLRLGLVGLVPRASQKDRPASGEGSESGAIALRTPLFTQVAQTGRHDHGIDVDLGQLAVTEPCHRLRIGDDLHLGERLRDLPLGAGVTPPPRTTHTVIVQDQEALLELLIHEG